MQREADFGHLEIASEHRGETVEGVVEGGAASMGTSCSSRLVACAVQEGGEGVEEERAVLGVVGPDGAKLLVDEALHSGVVLEQAQQAPQLDVVDRGDPLVSRAEHRPGCLVRFRDGADERVERGVVLQEGRPERKGLRRTRIPVA